MLTCIGVRISLRTCQICTVDQAHSTTGKKNTLGINVPHPAYRNTEGATFKVKIGKHRVLTREIKGMQSPHKAHIVPIIIIITIMIVVSRRLIPALQLRRNTKRRNDPHRLNFLEFSEHQTGRHYNIRRWHVID